MTDQEKLKHYALMLANICIEKVNWSDINKLCQKLLQDHFFGVNNA